MYRLFYHICLIKGTDNQPNFGIGYINLKFCNQFGKLVTHQNLGMCHKSDKYNT